MLPRAARLSRGDFVKRRSFRAETPYFTASFSRGESTGGAAAVVSKKVATQAVIRHRLKRWMLASIRPKDLRGVQVVLYAKKTATELTRKKFLEEVQAVLLSITATHKNHHD